MKGNKTLKNATRGNNLTRLHEAGSNCVNAWALETSEMEITAESEPHMSYNQIARRTVATCTLFTMCLGMHNKGKSYYPTIR